jgi:hypothetical protein
MQPNVRLRSAAVLLAGAYAVHTLRYALTYRTAANSELLAQGHGYLGAAPVALTVVLAAAVGELVLRVARGGGGRGPASSLRRVWGVCATALLAIFVAQELAEGWLATGHPDGLAAVFAHGGWLAGPLSAAVGLLVALLHRGAAAALAASRGRVPRPRVRALSVVLASCLTGVGVSRVPGPWLGGRGPPAHAG